MIWLYVCCRPPKTNSASVLLRETLIFYWSYIHFNETPGLRLQRVQKPWVTTSNIFMQSSSKLHSTFFAHSHCVFHEFFDLCILALLAYQNSKAMYLTLEVSLQTANKKICCVLLPLPLFPTCLHQLKSLEQVVCVCCLTSLHLACGHNYT